MYIYILITAVIFISLKRQLYNRTNVYALEADILLYYLSLLRVLLIRDSLDQGFSTGAVPPRDGSLVQGGVLLISCIWGALKGYRAAVEKMYIHVDDRLLFLTTKLKKLLVFNLTISLKNLIAHFNLNFSSIQDNTIIIDIHHRNMKLHLF